MCGAVVAAESGDGGRPAGLTQPSFAARPGTTLYTETKSQYCTPMAAIFHNASTTADASAGAKLMTRPEWTGASSFQLRLIWRTT